MEMEEKIAALAEKGAALFAEADIIESEMAIEVDRLLGNLLAGDWSNFLRASVANN